MRKVAVLAVLFFASCAGVLRAHSTHASITCRVIDPSKTIIVDAKVAANSTGTDRRYEGATNGSGTKVELSIPAAEAYATSPRRSWWSQMFSKKSTDVPFG